MANTLMRLYQEVLDNQRMVVYEYELAVISGLRQFEARIVPSGEDETVTFVRDVTALRQAEKQALELALEQERVHLLTEFIRTASHEFLTPLAIINSSADLILRIEDPDHRREKVSQITQQVSHVSKLVEMLLTVVTLETLHPDKNPIDLPDLVGGLCIEMRTLPEIGDRLRSTIALDLPVVNGYPAHLRMAIRNLIENAARYSKSDAPIFLRAFAQDAEVIIEVEDTGIGISQESIGHIFDTFWRSDEAHTTPGFGLGLAITRKVVELHGGRIEVTSEVGKGSLFRIRLPAERSDVPE
ncbi:hypothetical protein FBR02_20340 [Anaerolineae bacterium CFX9]|nr:hypothetical protein [Anaerolineae bacterium CFX9]